MTSIAISPKVVEIGVDGVKGLLAHVKATGEDEESSLLFCEIAYALLPDHFPSTIDHDQERTKWRVLKFGKLVDAGAWTDAALAICARALPGWKWSVSYGYADSDGGPYYATVMEGRTRVYEPIPGKSPSLAILAALLTTILTELRLDRERT